MLTVRIIPCLDVDAGRIVKGVRFSNLRDAGSPADRAAIYEAQGADEIVILDVSATPEGRRTALETVREVRRRVAIPLTVGGGVRSVPEAAGLLEAGADKVAVNSAAVRRPDLLIELAGQFGRQCTVLAVDAARPVDPAGGQGDPGWEVVINSGTERHNLDPRDWCRIATDLGAGEILLTSWDRDGTRSGYDLELITAVTAAVNVPVIASGGAADSQHLLAALQAGAAAVLAASIFHDDELTVGELKEQLARQGVRVRP
jgi:imidazoleglycerol phosphate synthase cyclase subunit